MAPVYIKYDAWPTGWALNNELWKEAAPGSEQHLCKESICRDLLTS